jgi:hypothetical protein
MVQKIGLRSLAVVVFLWGAGCSTIHALDTGGVRTMPLAEFAALPGQVGAEQLTEQMPFIVHIAAGETVPMQIQLELPLATLQAGENVLQFKCDVYLYIARDAMEVSPDGVRWATMGDFDAIKELFGVGQGSFRLGFGATADEGAIVTAALVAE